MAFLARVEEQSERLFKMVVADVNRLKQEMPDTKEFTALLKPDEMCVTGFWASVYEDCVAGIAYTVIPTDNEERAVEREFPLHKVPWNYNRAVTESGLIADQVARDLALTYIARNSLAQVVKAGSHQRMNYSAVVPAVYGDAVRTNDNFHISVIGGLHAAL